jgi:hypothetical protein
MRVGAASPSCLNVAVLLGVRDGEGFRRHQGITVMNVRSLVEPAVAEMELDPGEYHVVAYRCQTQARHQDGGRAPTPGTYRTSFASFTLQPARSSTSATCTSRPGAVGRTSFGRPIG